MNSIVVFAHGNNFSNDSFGEPRPTLVRINAERVLDIRVISKQEQCRYIGAQSVIVFQEDNPESQMPVFCYDDVDDLKSTLRLAHSISLQHRKLNA